MLEQFLKDVHTDDHGHIKIDDSEKALKLSVELIESEQSTDTDSMIDQLIDSDEMRELAKAFVLRDSGGIAKIIDDLALLSKKNLEEAITDILRAL